MTTITRFQNTVEEYYQAHGRHNMPWRNNTDTYFVAVSEVMLQQTQVNRVEPKFLNFIKAFPDWQTLANAPQAQVIKLWQGLGYNRRAINLYKTAKLIAGEYNSNLPSELEELVALPGIGVATAGAILAYGYNKPVVFIETNIRRAFIYSFFQNQEPVKDSDIVPILQDTIKNLPSSFSPRTWYWALTDYGAYIKTIVKNPNQKSHHYSKQSVFGGSNREVRGLILKCLVQNNSLMYEDLESLPLTVEQKKNLSTTVDSLLQEGFVERSRGRLRLL